MRPEWSLRKPREKPAKPPWARRGTPAELTILDVSFAMTLNHASYRERCLALFEPKFLQVYQIQIRLKFSNLKRPNYVKVRKPSAQTLLTRSTSYLVFADIVAKQYLRIA